MAYMQVEMFSQTLHMAVGVDVILPQPVKNEIGLESGEKRIRNIRHCGCFMEQPMTRQRGSGGHPSERYVAPLGLAVVMPRVPI